MIHLEPHDDGVLVTDGFALLEWLRDLESRVAIYGQTPAHDAVADLRQAVQDLLPMPQRESVTVRSPGPCSIAAGGPGQTCEDCGWVWDEHSKLAQGVLKALDRLEGGGADPDALRSARALMSAEERHARNGRAW